jgi:hypothetical protein
MMLHPAPSGRQALDSESGATSSTSRLARSPGSGASGPAFELVALAVIEVDMTARKAANRDAMIRRALVFDAFTNSSFWRRMGAPVWWHRDAMLAVAALGGHLKSNGDPGLLVLGRGMHDLLILELGRRAREAAEK